MDSKKSAEQKQNVFTLKIKLSGSNKLSVSNSVFTTHFRVDIKPKSYIAKHKSVSGFVNIHWTR